MVQLKYLVRANAGSMVLMTTVHTNTIDTTASSVDFLARLILMSFILFVYKKYVDWFYEKNTDEYRGAFVTDYFLLSIYHPLG